VNRKIPGTLAGHWLDGSAVFLRNNLEPIEYPKLAVRCRRDNFAIMIQMNEQPGLAIGTPDLPVSVLEQRWFGDFQPAEELDSLTE
jgi:hypothetical protein